MTNLNTAIPPTVLLTGTATLDGPVPISQIILPQSSLEREITRILLVTTLTAADMYSATYWDGAKVQAPFYWFSGAPALSNLQSATQIGNFNVGEWITPLFVPANTDFIGRWIGVNSGSAGKCQATIHLRAARP